MPQCLIFKMGICSSKNTAKIGIKTNTIEKISHGPYLSSSDNDSGSCISNYPMIHNDTNDTNVSCEDSDSGSYIEKVYTSLDDILIGSCHNSDSDSMCQDSDCGSDSGCYIEKIYTSLDCNNGDSDSGMCQDSDCGSGYYCIEN